MVDLIVTFNDPLKGPTALMHESTEGSKDPSLPLKVAVKSQLTLSLMDKDATIKTADAVLPFPDLRKISFSYIFMVNSAQGAPITSSISYIVPQSENINLYRMIPSLKDKLSGIVDKFHEWTYKSDFTSLPKNLHDLLVNNLLSGEVVTTKEVRPGDISVVTDVASGSPDYLLKKVKKNLEYAIFELFTEKPVILAGKSRFAVEYGMATLDFLIPHKHLRKIMYSENYIDPKKFKDVDLIGVSSNHEKKYYNEYVVINVDKFEVKGQTKGKRNYFKKFINKLKELDVNNARQDIFVATSSLLKSTEAIVELFSTVEDVEEEKLNQIIKDMEVDEKEVVTEIAATYNPLIAEKIRVNLSEKVASWMDDFGF
jgi:hypothetical protein